MKPRVICLASLIACFAILACETAQIKIKIVRQKGLQARKAKVGSKLRAKHRIAIISCCRKRSCRNVWLKKKRNRTFTTEETFLEEDEPIERTLRTLKPGAGATTLSKVDEGGDEDSTEGSTVSDGNTEETDKESTSDSSSSPEEEPGSSTEPSVDSTEMTDSGSTSSVLDTSSKDSAATSATNSVVQNSPQVSQGPTTVGGQGSQAASTASSSSSPSSTKSATPLSTMSANTSTSSTMSVSSSSSTNTSTISSATSSTTTTTVNPKACKSPSCDSFKKSLNISANNTLPLGAFKYFPPEKRFIFVSDQTASVWEASLLCANLNMNLLALENPNVLPKLQLLLGKKIAWTSGSNEGNQCDVERTFAWCSNGALFNATNNASDLWVSQSGLSNASRCVAVDTAKLMLSDCGQSNSFVCEPKCDTATNNCPQSCAKDPNLFANGVLMNRDQYGIWVNQCDTSYLFGNKFVNWIENVAKCCKLGMEPIILKKPEEQLCISDVTKKHWTGNWNYWTGGVQGCKGLWGWCSGSQFSPVENLTWALNQPEFAKSDENCLHLRILSNGSGAFLNDRKCKDKYIFACQAPNQNKTPIAIACEQSCQANNDSFSSSKLTNPFSLGDWYSTCGKQLFFPFKKDTWSGAWNYCCSVGMRLLSIQTSRTLACLTKLSKRFSNITNAGHWLSGRGAGGSFKWCDSGKDFGKINWKSGQPSAVDGDCVFLQFSNTSANLSTFSTGNCEQERFFVCEKSRQATEDDALQEECMDLYDLYWWDVEVFLNASFNASALSLKQKCFIKCIGDQLGLLVGNELALTIEALIILEEMSTDEQSLQTSVEILDECGNKVNQDECARAADIYQCGKEKAPAITSAIESGLKSSAPMPGGSLSVPYVPVDKRTCRLEDLPCVVNQTLKDLLDSTGQTPMGSVITAPSGTKFFISHTFSLKSRTYMHNYCCGLGMRLAEIRTAADLTAVANKAGLEHGYGTMGHVGDIFLNGQEKDIWCYSKAPMFDASIYAAGQSMNYNEAFMCYFFHVGKLAGQTDVNYRHCLPDQETSRLDFFLCSTMMP